MFLHNHSLALENTQKPKKQPHVRREKKKQNKDTGLRNDATKQTAPK
jgi:hypothetical protein